MKKIINYDKWLTIKLSKSNLDKLNKISQVEQVTKGVLVRNSIDFIIDFYERKGII